MTKFYILAALVVLELAGFVLIPDVPQAAPVYSTPRYSCIHRVDYQWVPCWMDRWESKA